MLVAHGCKETFHGYLSRIVLNEVCPRRPFWGHVAKHGQTHLRINTELEIITWSRANVCTWLAAHKNLKTHIWGLQCLQESHVTYLTKSASGLPWHRFPSTGSSTWQVTQRSQRRPTESLSHQHCLHAIATQAWWNSKVHHPGSPRPLQALPGPA